MTRTETARPLRALAVMLCLYGCGRLAVAARFPDFAVFGFQPARADQPRESIAYAPDTPRAAVAAVIERAAVLLAPPAYAEPRTTSARLVIAIPPRIARPTSTGHQARPAAPTPVALAQVVADVRRPAIALVQTGPINPPALTAGGGAPPQVAAPLSPSGRRALSGSAWALIREGSAGTSLAPGGTLGGSQIGARLNWQPTAAPVFLTVRASAALCVRDGEIAPGIGVRGRQGGVILEQRVPLQRGRSSRTALLAYGGVSDLRAPLGVKLDGYVQGGVVGMSDPALFIDGAARAERPVVGIGPARLGAGAAVWGAAQPGATRLDIGPQAVLHLPLGPVGARLSAEYRVRVAGKARPGNGVTLTLGAGF